MKRLAIVVTHPIQYYVPIFKRLAIECHLKVFYTWGETWLYSRYDPGFGKNIEWDIPLLEGYEYEFVKNTAINKGSSHRDGIINPFLKSNIENFQPHAILVHGYRYKSHLQILRYFKGKIPIWFRGDSHLLNNKFGLRSVLKKIYLTWVYSHVDKAFYVGKNNYQYYRHYGLRHDQLIFSPHAIDNERYAEPRLEEVVAFRKKMKLSNSDILLMYAGKFESGKNLSVLINAFKSLKIQDKIKLLLVGNGPEEKHLKNLAADCANILFLDFQNQAYLPVLYQSCDIFCLTSKSETWGLAVNEAMAAGKPIITSNKVGCAVDLIREGVNGYTFKSDHQKSLELVLNKLSSKILIDMGEKSKQIINDWNFNKVVQTYITNLN